MSTVRIRDDVVLGGPKLVLIAGPCVIESERHALEMAAAISAVAAHAGVSYVFKASFDKANRSSLDSYRGPGLDAGLKTLEKISSSLGVAVTTDVHEPGQAAATASVVDLLQVPALLCRQTDLLLSCAATSKPVNVKKGQFMAPGDMKNVVNKLRSVADSGGVALTERGSSFGYHNLVVDMRSLPQMRALGVPVVFDATHSVQLPGGEGTRSGGERRFIRPLARAAVSVGVDAIFMEVHDKPDEALSDGPNNLPLSELPALLEELVAIDNVARRFPLAQD